MFTRIYVNQHVIRRNNKKPSAKEMDPPIAVKNYKSNQYGDWVYIDGPCRVVYTPTQPLSCGAKVWIETEAGVRVYVTDKDVLA